MINATELRIGNWVTTEFVNEYVIIDAIHPSDVGKVELLNIKKARCFVEFTFLKPVPLTPEILEKCGFEVLNFNNKHFWIRFPGGEIGDYRLHVFPESGNQSFWHLSFSDNISGKQESYSGKIKFRYLHQLQNLYFALTGEELEIKELL